MDAANFGAFLPSANPPHLHFSTPSWNETPSSDDRQSMAYLPQMGTMAPKEAVRDELCVFRATAYVAGDHDFAQELCAVAIIDILHRSIDVNSACKDRILVCSGGVTGSQSKVSRHAR